MVLARWGKTRAVLAQAGERESGSGLVGESESSSGQAGVRESGSGPAGESESSSGQAGVRESGSGPAGERESSSGQAGVRESSSGPAGERESGGDECSIEGLKGNGCAPVKWRVTDGVIILFLEKGWEMFTQTMYIIMLTHMHAHACTYEPSLLF